MKLPNNEIKILLILPFFHPHKGGSQKYAEELHLETTKINPNVKTTVVTYNTKGIKEHEFYRGIEIHRIPCYVIIKDKFLLPHPARLIKKLKELAQNNYDFIETHVRFFDSTWWAWKYAKKIKAKSIYFGHVPNHPVDQNKLVAFVGKLTDLLIAKNIVNKYDYVFYANSAAKLFHEKILGVKKAGKVISIAVNPTEFLTNQQDKQRIIPKTNKALGEEKVLVSYIGRMIETKGPTYFLEAIKILKKELPLELWQKLMFCFAGPGDLNKGIYEKVKKLGLSENVSVLGELDYSEVKELLSINDIFVSPSTFDEGLPNTLLEAGASGNYIITTESGSIGDLIKDAYTGKIVPKKNAESIVNAIKEVAFDKKKRALSSHNLMALIENQFVWEKSATDYLREISK